MAKIGRAVYAIFLLLGLLVAWNWGSTALAGFEDLDGGASLTATGAVSPSVITSTGLPELRATYVVTTAAPGAVVSVPIVFTGNDNNVTSLAFSIDYDQNCLALSGSGAVSVSVPADFTTSVTFDAGDTNGEVDVLIADTSTPLAVLPDGPLATLNLTVVCQPDPGSSIRASVFFASDPPVSFGDTSGRSLSGNVSSGWVEIVSTESGPTPAPRPDLRIAYADSSILPGEVVTLPVTFTGNGSQISALVFSVDYDQNCLALDGTDGDDNGMPDSVLLHLPAEFGNVSVTFDPGDASGEVDFLLADTSVPLTTLGDGPVASLAFTATCHPTPGSSQWAVVNFASDPPVSFGSVDGQSVPGNIGYGGVNVVSSEPTPTPTPTPELRVVSPPYPVAPGMSVNVPISFTAHGTQISSVGFSLDYDESCLGFDPTDADNNGIPDNVAVTVPAGFTTAVQYGDHAEGELDFLLYDFMPPMATLPDSVLVTVTLSAECQPSGDASVQAYVNFASQPPVSFGNGQGQSVPGTAINGMVEIVRDVTATVSGMVFQDDNGNGVRDSGEGGIANVTINLVGEDGTHTTVTDGSGAYQFTDVVAGAYTVAEVDLAGYVSTTPNQVIIALPAGSVAMVDFGDRQTGSASGVVFNDINGNGTQDPGELGIGGVHIDLVGSTTLSTTTAVSGTYQFTRVVPGNYTVVETDPAGYVSTTPNSADISVPAGGSASANFGDRQEGSVSGVVFDDTNGNGIQESGESGLAGVQIELLGSTTITATTDVSGTYRFTNVAVGSYTVVESDPAGYASTTPNSVGITVSAGGSATANFGDQQVGTVSGVVFSDVNGNGTQDSGETGIASVTISLTSGAGTRTATTDVSGAYEFTNVVAGNYTVVETDPAGYVSTTPNSATFTVPAGGNATANFGDQQVGSISGVVFSDVNGNGTQDSGESGLAGVGIALVGSATVTATTDVSGTYRFTSVVAGSYTVVETDPAGYVSTTPNSVTVTVAAGGSASANFGDQQVGSVSGVVFDDANGNGVQNVGESGIANVTVILTGDDGTRTATTLSNGAYQFANVAAGSYTVVETDPAGYVSTTPNSVAVTVPAGGSASANFGDQQVGSVSGVVFNDVNGNGVQDTGESGISGVQIELVNGTILTTTTLSDGGYQFANVVAGSYMVVETDPTGHVSTTPNSVAITVPAGGNATANFGDQQVGSVSGVVFDDVNGNGAQDNGETGIGGVQIELKSGDVTRTATTLSNGAYQFANVAAGSYTVVETDPAGYVSTTPNSVAVTVPAGGSASANFGDQQVGSVSGVVFDDVNGNGTQESDESGISGVQVELVGGTILTTTTLSDGAYQFANVVAGGYTVVETDPAGYVSTTPNSVAVTVPAGGSASANFGDQQVGAVSGVVFHDVNGNGVQNTGENGIGGVQIELKSGDVTHAVTTLSNGAYQFANVVAGSYTVVETDPAGYVSTTPNSVAVTVPAGGSVTANFGDQQVGTVSGVVFDDVNGNGVQESDESGISGVQVELAGGAIFTTTTLSDGAYQFANVVAGSYTVVETDPAGYVSTTPNSVAVTVPAGGSASADFGDQQVGTVSGVVFDDVNGNGVQNVGESGIANVTVSLTGDDSTRTTTTLSTGMYVFADVVAGEYMVVETDLAGYASTTPNSVAVSVGAGGSAGANFGDRQGGTVSGVVFDDSNGNGTQDSGETGIANVQVRLTGSTVITTTTLGTGAYQFTNVAVGNYTVVEIDPAGFASTTPNSVTVSVGAGGSASANFGDRQAGTVSGVVFNDANGNGIQDSGESGIANVAVTLSGDGGTHTATTNTSGAYQFTDVATGNYMAVETDPAGYVSTTPNSIAVTVAAGGGASANFGDRRVGTVSGVVFNDANGNGTQDGSEGGIGNVRVRLVGDATIVATTTAAGVYQFENVMAGAYTAVEADLAGYVSTTPNSVAVSVAAGGSASANFGDRRAGTIGGVVFNDTNGNGTQDSGELGISGAHIALVGSSSSVTNTTLGDGSYLFNNVTAGNYSVVETDPIGFVSTTPNVRAIYLAVGNSAAANFGDQPTASVSGVVFHDLNGNGTRDTGESGIGNVEIRLESSSGGTHTTRTVGDGTYTFGDVAPGAYTVLESDPAGYMSTTPNAVVVSLVANGSSSANFGDRQVGTVSGLVFNDVNGDGTWQAGELGVGSVQISLVGNNTTTTTTAGNGQYLFSSVAEGTYTVQETDPTGYVSSSSNTVTVLVAAAGSATANFADQQAGTVGGAVFEDINGNGTHDSSEQGIAGVKITLVGNDTVTTTTTGDGSYLFTGLSPFAYTVVEQDPSGYGSTTPNTVVVSVGSGGSAGANFGDQPQGSISGVVFNDTNGNGRPDASESGLGSVLISLSNGMTTTTTGNGMYVFGDLSPDRYAVREADPVGFSSTTSNYVLVSVAAGSGETLNFGDVETGAINGQVFVDGDGNGSFNNGESGLGGVLVDLKQGTSTLDQIITAGDGTFTFRNLTPGTYTVVETDPSGFVSTTENQVTVLMASGGSASVYFGDRGIGRIYGRVFHDLNGDGDRNRGEDGLGGVLVTLKDADGNPLNSLHTDSSGGFEFTNLAQGTYVLEETDPDGFTSITSNQATIYLVQSSSVRFADAVMGTIGGEVVLVRDTGQSVWRALSGVIVELWDHSRTTQLAQTTTAGNGHYHFANQVPGNYWVYERNPSRYWSLTSDWVQVHLPSNGNATANFYDGYDPCVFGFVYSDLNLDGFLTEGEPTLSGVPVRLVQASDGEVVRALETDGDGSYLFQDVDLGTYQVEIDAPEGWTLATEHPVAVALVDKDQGETVTFGLVHSGSSATTTRTTVQVDGEVRGRVQDTGNQGLAGIFVTVKDAQGKVVASTSTIADGSYRLGDLSAGYLTVEAATPPNYVGATTGVRTVYVDAGRSVVANFTYVAQDAGIGGFIFRDENGNGARDAREPGIGGVAVQLRQNGQVVQTTQSTASGAYSFSLIDGIYEILVQDVEGHISTTPNQVRAIGPALVHFGKRFAENSGSGVETASVVTGYVYNDVDGSATNEAGERPLGGMSVELRTLDDSLTMTTTTSGDGRYTFDDVQPGSYKVTLDRTPGFLPTTPSSLSIWAAAGHTSPASFGLRYVTLATGRGAVAGRVFNDLDGSQRLHPNEPALSGLRVRLLNADNVTVAVKSTAGDGTFLFADLPAGHYRAALDVPDGFVATTQVEYALTVSSNQLSSVRFGVLAANTVSGAVFFDVDGDGVRHTTERGAGGLLVRLYASDNQLVTQTTTAANGQYVITGVASSTYTVSLSVPTGLVTTSASERLVSVDANHAAAASMGVQTVGTVTGFVFRDLDDSGSRDENESGISGVRITLNGDNVAETTTSSNGLYQFFDIAAGSYSVEQTVPTGFVNPENQATVAIGEASYASASFGNRFAGTISGVVFQDVDSDGSKSAGEPGAGGVELQLYVTESTDPVLTTRTRSDGSYELQPPAGAYQLVIGVPDAFKATTPDQVAVTLGVSSSSTVNFGLAPGLISKLIFLPTVAAAGKGGSTPGTESPLFLPLMYK